MATWFVACAGDDDFDDARTSDLGGGGTSSGNAGGSGGGANPTPPDEHEVEESYTAPVVSGRWLWTANPLSGKVALIDTKTMDVRTADAGIAPTFVAALGNSTDTESGAIVLNVGNDTASVLTFADGVINVETVRVHPGANRMTVSAGGNFAIVWSDATLLAQPDPTEGLQDITVLDLRVSPAVSSPLTVGYRPSRVTIGEGESHVYFVTEAGISVVELPETDAPTVTRDIPVTDDPMEAATLRDVTVTPDGKVAIVRRSASATVNVVSLENGTRVDVTLPGAVSDLDLASDGETAFAVARNVPIPSQPDGEGGAGAEPATGGSANGAGTGGQSGENGLGGEGGAEAGASNGGQGANEGGGPGTGGTPSTGSGLFSGGTAGTGSGTGGSAGSTQAPGMLVSYVAMLPLTELFRDPKAFSQIAIEEEVGSIVVAPDGDRALLYTNAIANDHVTIFDTKAFEVVRTVDVQAPVRAVLPSPDGKHAVAVLEKTPGSQKAGGFSLIPLTTTLAPKIIGTDAPTQSVALGVNQGLITVEGLDAKGAKVHAVYLAQLPGFSTKQITLGSPPVSAGLVLEEELGFIAQSHPEGRITFLNLDSGQPRTITGFELSAKVVQGE